MLQKFEMENDINRQEVIEYLKNSEFELEKFEIEEFKDYPGGIKLTDKKQREIIVYNNYLLGKVEVVYRNLKMIEDALYISIKVFLWNDYIYKAKKHNQIVRKKEIDENHIRFIRQSKTKDKATKIIEISPIFDLNNQLYDAYEYLSKQIKKLDNQK